MGGEALPLIFFTLEGLFWEDLENDILGIFEGGSFLASELKVSE